MPLLQFSLFGAAAVEPTLADLDGVLLGGGHWVRRADGARLSVVLLAKWRADALREAFAALGVGSAEADADADLRPAPTGQWIARTGFAADLTRPAARWTRGAREAPPADLVVAPGGLRLWAVTSGRDDRGGYLLGTAESEDERHRAAGAALARLGLAAVDVSRRAGGPGWRVTSARRRQRLAELVGAAPEGAGADWPA